MNGDRAALGEIDTLARRHPAPACDILLCPPATLLASMVDHVGKAAIAVGGQDCHAAAKGAHTGDIAAAMLADAGASHVIVGHSERRADHGETDAMIAAKAKAAWDASLCAVICLGETGAEREAGQTLEIIARQLQGSVPDGATGKNTVIAYEPVWAIGTGLVPTDTQIAEVHAALRSHLRQRFPGEADSVRLLYGGSVKGSNAAQIFAIADVDGALVGGASLKSEDFSPIIEALESA
jgi:triosephosphate isomerase